MLFGGFGDRLTDRQTEIGGCRVTFVTENLKINTHLLTSMDLLVMNNCSSLQSSCFCHIFKESISFSVF